MGIALIQQKGGSNLEKLTSRQEKFVANYLESGNGTQSAIDAGYSRKTSYSIANELLKNPEIAKTIADKRKEMWDRFINDAEQAYEVLKAIINDENASYKTRLDAVNSLLDRAGFKPAERKEITGANGSPVQVESRVTSELAQRARQMLAEKNS